MRISNHHITRGGSLFEVVIGLAILLIVMVGIMSAHSLFLRSSRTTLRVTQSQSLLEEGLEATRFMRDAAWSNLASSTVGISYTLSFNGSGWTFTQTPVLIDGVFDRRVVLSPVYRDGDQDIASSGSLDTNIKQVTVTVSWLENNATTSRTLATYLSNLF